MISSSAKLIISVVIKLCCLTHEQFFLTRILGIYFADQQSRFSHFECFLKAEYVCAFLVLFVKKSLKEG